jgi:hypothetical protein
LLTCAPDNIASNKTILANGGILSKTAFVEKWQRDTNSLYVCDQENLLSEVTAENNWRMLKVEGPLDFSLTGILASIVGPLAEAKISIFAI